MPSTFLLRLKVENALCCIGSPVFWSLLSNVITIGVSDSSENIFWKKKIKWAKTFLLASYLDITLINWTGNYANGRIVKQTCMCFCVTGLTCTEQNFITKSGSQRAASEHGIIIVAPDTSPREWKGDSYTHKTHT